MKPIKTVSRFLCDPGDDPNPQITVFLRTTVEVANEKITSDDWVNPIKVMLLDLESPADLCDANKLIKIAADRGKVDAAAAEAAAAKNNLKLR